MANIVLVVNNSNFSASSTPAMQAIFGSGSGYIPSGNQTGLRGNAVWMTVNASSPSSIIPGVLQYKFIIPNDLMQPFTFGEILLVDVGGTVMYAIGVLDQPVVRAADEAIECIMYFDVRGTSTSGFGNTHGSATIPAIPFYQAISVLPPAVQATSIVMVVANPANPGGSILASISYANPSIQNDFTSWSFTDYSLMSFDVVTDVIGNEIQLPISPPVNPNIATGQFLLQTVNFTTVCSALTPTSDRRSVLLPLSNYQVSLMPVGTPYKMYEYSSMNSASASFINRLNVTPDQINAMARLGADKVLLSDGSVQMRSNFNLGGFIGVNSGTPESTDTNSLVNVAYTTVATGLSAMAANGIGNELLTVRAEIDSLIPKINLLMAWMLAGGSPVDYEHICTCTGTGTGTGSEIYPTHGAWSVPDKHLGDAPFTLTHPTSNSPGTWLFISSDPSILSVVQSTVNIVGIGSVQLTAFQNPIQGYLGASTQATCRVTYTGVEVFTAPSTVPIDQPFTESIIGGTPNTMFNMVVNGTPVLTNVVLDNNGAWSQVNSMFSTAGSYTLVVTFAATGNSITKVITATSSVAPTLGAIANAVTAPAAGPNKLIYWPTSNSSGTWSAVAANTTIVASISYPNTSSMSIAGNHSNSAPIGTTTITMTQAAVPGFLAASVTINFTFTGVPELAAMSKALDAPNLFTLWPTGNEPGIWTIVATNPAVAVVTSSSTGFTITGNNAGSVGSTVLTLTSTPAGSGYVSVVRTINLTVTAAVATVWPGYVIYVNGSTTPNDIVATRSMTYMSGKEVKSVLSAGVPYGKVHSVQTGPRPLTLDFVLDANGGYTADVLSETLNPVGSYAVAITYTNAAGNNPSAPFNWNFTVTSNPAGVPPTLGAKADITRSISALNDIVYWPTSNSTGAWSAVSANPAIAAIHPIVLSGYFLIAGNGNGSVGTTTITLTQAASPGFWAASVTFNITITA